MGYGYFLIGLESIGQCQQSIYYHPKRKAVYPALGHVIKYIHNIINPPELIIFDLPKPISEQTYID